VVPQARPNSALSRTLSGGWPPGPQLSTPTDLAFAEALDLDPATCWEVLRHGAAASFMFDDRGRRMVEGTDEVKSALDIFVKDMGLVVDAARQSTYPAPLASAAEQLYLAGRRAGLGRSDDSAVIEVLPGAPLTSAHQPAEGAGR
jgi:hypothetical protein